MGSTGLYTDAHDFQKLDFLPVQNEALESL